MKKKILIIALCIILALAAVGVIVWVCLAGRDNGKKDDNNNTVCQHVMGDWVVTKEASCTVEGWRIKYCKYCNLPVHEMLIEMLPHSEGVWIVDKEPTVDEDGKHHTECTVCGLIMNEELIPSLSVACDHEESDWIVDKEPTANEGGKRHTECTKCQMQMKEEIIPAFDE